MFMNKCKSRSLDKREMYERNSGKKCLLKVQKALNDAACCSQILTVFKNPYQIILCNLAHFKKHLHNQLQTLNNKSPA